jgi:hypothetical protein
MKTRFKNWLMTTFLICGMMLFGLCITDDNTVRQDDAPARIGMAWRGEITAITYTSMLQSVREVGAMPW